MEESEFQYFVNRMNKELKAAETATSDAARAAHESLAAQYRQMLVERGYDLDRGGDSRIQAA